MFRVFAEFFSMMLLVFTASVFALEKEPFSYERFEAL